MIDILLILLILLSTALLKSNYTLNKNKNSLEKRLTQSVFIETHLEQLKIHEKNIQELNSMISELKVLRVTKDSKITELTAQLKTTVSNHKLQLKESVEAARKDALKKSRAILRGQASEHLAPFVVGNTNPKDYRFMGNPIDYICFDGLSNLLDGVSNDISCIRFVDVKTGKSSLNKSQRRIRDAIKAGKVVFEVLNLDEKLKEDIIDEKST